MGQGGKPALCPAPASLQPEAETRGGCGASPLPRLDLHRPFPAPRRAVNHCRNATSHMTRHTGRGAAVVLPPAASPAGENIPNPLGNSILPPLTPRCAHNQPNASQKQRGRAHPGGKLRGARSKHTQTQAVVCPKGGCRLGDTAGQAVALTWGAGWWQGGAGCRGWLAAGSSEPSCGRAAAAAWPAHAAGSARAPARRQRPCSGQGD